MKDNNINIKKVFWCISCGKKAFCSTFKSNSRTTSKKIVAWDVEAQQIKHILAQKEIQEAFTVERNLHWFVMAKKHNFCKIYSELKYSVCPKMTKIDEMCKIATELLTVAPPQNGQKMAYNGPRKAKRGLKRPPPNSGPKKSARNWLFDKNRHAPTHQLGWINVWWSVFGSTLFLGAENEENPSLGRTCSGRNPSFTNVF